MDDSWSKDFRSYQGASCLVQMDFLGISWKSNASLVDLGNPGNPWIIKKSRPATLLDCDWSAGLLGCMFDTVDGSEIRRENHLGMSTTRRK